METSETLYVGVKGQVVAFSKRDGTELWKADLSGGSLAGDSFVTLLADGERVYAHTYGKLFCLDAYTGDQLWSNPLRGLGYGMATLAVAGASSPEPTAQAKLKRARAAAAGVP